MTLDVDTLDQVLLVGAGVLLLAILAVRLSVGVGLPSLLVYLLMGVALGESGIGFAFDNAELAHALGFAALILILAEGGLTTSWPDIRPVMRLGVSLATIGVGVSVLVMAVFAHYVLGLSWELAVLLGAITSPTDAAAVFSVLRQVPLPRRLTGTLEAESGLNDAPTIVLVTLISTDGGDSVLEFAGVIAWELVVGTVGGLLVGFGGAWLMRRSALPSSGLYPLAVLSFTVLAYAGTAALHGSGFAAVYVSALILGNAELPHRQATRSFSEGVAWLAQIGLFVMLGLLVSPDRIDLQTVGTAIVAGLALTLLARPLSVAAASLVQPMPRRELAFLSWAGLRGAVPIVLATIPLAEAIDGATQLFDIVFVMVVIYTLLTGPTLPAGREGAQGGASQRAARPRGRGGAAGADRGRPVAGDDLAEVADARRGGGRASAAARLVGGADRPGRQDAGPGASYGAAPRRRRARGHPTQEPGGHREAPAIGVRRRAAGAVARQEGADLSVSRPARTSRRGRPAGSAWVPSCSGP